ncbi:MAG: DUF1214 domain-containing protein [Acidimicrobiales bacterium]
MSNESVDQSRFERGRDGTAWRDFCDTLRAAGDIIVRYCDDDLERAEGFRYLSRLTRNSLERFVENSEPYRPRVRDTPWRSWIGIQSPDQDHPLIEIDGAHEYRIIGRRGTVNYGSFLALASRVPDDVGAVAAPASPEDALAEFDPTAYRPTGFLNVHDLTVEPDGSFEIIISPTEQKSNWLRSEADTSFIMIRQTFLDRSTEHPMELRVERLDAEPARPIKPGDVAKNLAIAGQNVVGTTVRFLSWAKELERLPNALTRIDEHYRDSGGSPDHLMYFGYWEVEPDEALVVTARLPANDHWNFQACNWWLENFDNYEEGQGYTTKQRARNDADGTVTLVLAHRPVDVGNWIDIDGHRRGTMNLRMVHPQGDADIATRKVPFAELAS